MGMERIMQRSQALLKELKSSPTYLKEQKNQTMMTSYSCQICKDKEFILNKETDRYEPCECRETRRCERMIENSGISEGFRQKTFKNYNPISDETTKNKMIAMDYAKNFTKIEKGEYNSIGFLGQVGSGKTHLSLAIANNLLLKKIAVLYMPYREVITVIKQNMLDAENYQRYIEPYKKARVLVIDDLFKGRITDSDINIMFEIINYRDLKNAPIIVSSEFTATKLLEFDEGTGSRIVKMCGDGKRLIEFTGQNYRLRNIL